LNQFGNTSDGGQKCIGKSRTIEMWIIYVCNIYECISTKIIKVHNNDNSWITFTMEIDAVSEIKL